MRCSTCTEPAVGYLTENLRPYCAEHLEQMIGAPVVVALQEELSKFQALEGRLDAAIEAERGADAAFLRSLGIEP